ncbi:MAG: SiaB family protein kinase [Flavobacteriales bacterium]
MSIHTSNTSMNPNAGGKADFKTITELFHRFRSQDSTFCYRGAFSEQFTSTILDISAGSTYRTSGNVNKKVSFLLVECFQNIIKHGESAEMESLEDDGIFTFRIDKNGVVINSINHLLTQEKEALQDWVDKVNSLDSASLKELYLKQLNENELSSKSGAGLGLIELARKSGQKLVYEFENINAKYARFHQQVSFVPGELTKNIEETKSLYKLMNEENALLFYKGDFSQKSILPLLDIVEQNVSSGGGVTGMTRKVAHVLIELMQNISKHARPDEMGRKEGIFMIGLLNDHVYLQCGNVLSNGDKQMVADNLEYLTTLNKEELGDLHKAAMKASLKFENKNKSGLGLIEVVKAAQIGVQLSFEPIDAESFLFTIKVSF